jgi:hypothetical protein
LISDESKENTSKDCLLGFICELHKLDNNKPVKSETLSNQSILKKEYGFLVNGVF